MKKIPQQVDDTLLDYLDSRLEAAGVEKLEHGLRHNGAWQIRLEELKVIGASLKKTKLEYPSDKFTLSVMNKLDQYPVQSNFSTRTGIFLLAGILIVIGIASLLVSVGVFDDAITHIDLSQVALPKKYIKTPLPTFQFSGKLIVNMIIILNLGLALLVLDRIILKPFFRHRIQARH